MAWTDSASWFEVRSAHNRKPATYRCPLCGNQLPALIDHMLIFPDGDHARRRHAHSACVMRARRSGRLPTRDEWRRAQPRPADAAGPLVRGGPLAWIRRQLTRSGGG